MLIALLHAPWPVYRRVLEHSVRAIRLMQRFNSGVPWPLVSKIQFQVGPMVNLSMKHALLVFVFAGAIFLALGNGAPPLAVAATLDGKDVFAQTCAACHARGLAGAPRFGVRPDWAARLPLGRANLAQTVLRGKGGMPPKGGNASLTDAQALAALDYILAGVK